MKGSLVSKKNLSFELLIRTAPTGSFGETTTPPDLPLSSIVSFPRTSLFNRKVKTQSRSTSSRPHSTATLCQWTHRCWFSLFPDAASHFLSFSLLHFQDTYTFSAPSTCASDCYPSSSSSSLARYSQPAPLRLAVRLGAAAHSPRAS